MNNSLFKGLLVAQTIALLVYSFLAFQQEGAGLFQVFFSNISAFGWNGQFNLDFACYLLLSGLWIMWRNRFSGVSIGIGVVASVLGIIFFAPYLLYLLAKESGNVRKLLIGDR
jgi:uncharacterized membrane protein